MANTFSNLGYFLKETKTTVRMNFVTKLFSVLSIMLVFFIFSMVLCGWWISSDIIETVQGEAEVNIYFTEALEKSSVQQLVGEVKGLEGVLDARLVDEDEAYERMEDILGKEADVLGMLDENPFSSFIEVRIHLEALDTVVGSIENMDNVEYMRDNREVLNNLISVSSFLKVLSYVVVAAAAISLLVILTHIIRLGVYNNREQINTLRLLGAKEAFISAPFIFESILLTLTGGILATALTVFLLKIFYSRISGPLPFVPLPSYGFMTANLMLVVLPLSMVLGAACSSYFFSFLKHINQSRQ
jgi:cell division transport system permease protein